MFEIEMFNSRDYLHNEKIIKEVQVTTLYKQMVLFLKALEQDDAHTKPYIQLKKLEKKKTWIFVKLLIMPRFLIQRRILIEGEHDSDERR